MVTARRTMAPARGGRTAAVSSGYTGAALIAQMEEEQQRQVARKEARDMTMGQPHRFWVAPGESRDVIIVDDKPSFARYEHNLKNHATGRFDVYCACINENAHCPVCKHSERPSYYGLFFTIIDLTPFTNKDGAEIEWSKKLLCIKPQQQKKMMRLYEKYGTMRGLMLRMTRDGEKDAATGNDIEDLGFVEEADLEAYVTSFVDKKNVEHDVLGYEPYDYEELFPMPSEEQLRALVGGRSEPGSRDHDRRELRGGSARGGDDWDNDRRPAVRRRSADDDGGAAPRAAVRPAVRRGVAADEPTDVEARPIVRRGVARNEPVDEPVDEAGVEDERPARPAARPVARPPARAAAPVRRALPAARHEEAGEPVDDDPPQRAAARPAARGLPARAAEREAPPASSLADRRRALRR